MLVRSFLASTLSDYEKVEGPLKETKELWSGREGKPWQKALFSLGSTVPLYSSLVSFIDFFFALTLLQLLVCFPKSITLFPLNIFQ